VLTAVSHELSRPRRLEDVERFVEHPRAVAVVELLAGDRVLAGKTVAAEADAQRESAVAQPVEGRGLARDLGGTTPGERGDHRAEPDALGRAGDRGKRDLRVGHADDGLAPAHLVPHEDPVPARLLGLGAQAGDERWVGERVERRDVEAQAHSGVVEDRFDDDVPVGAVDAVSGFLEPQQPGAGDLLRERLAMLDRKHRIGGAVNHEGAGGDR
jgi:hypothetical protein